jgi:two-component system NtrC family sensor kinase
VVQNLLSFARQRKPQRQRVEVSKVLEETLSLREYDLRVNGIQLERAIDPDLPYVTADPHQLEQVFLNITNNAVDAMLEAGKGGKFRVGLGVENSEVLITFHDSGPGIKEPKRIFDPFYTTKSVGKGTGLGLSICYGIIKEHGGEISARNHEEGGAVIEVRLPSAGWNASPERVQQPAARNDLVFEGRVLLIEDEEAVLEFERDVLSGAGAQVVASMRAEEIKERLQHESFDAIILNGNMPGGGSAAETYSWLAERASGMEKRLLFTFSGPVDAATRAFLKGSHIPYLVKPFEVAELISLARRLLQKTQAATAG